MKAVFSSQIFAQKLECALCQNIFNKVALRELTKSFIKRWPKKSLFLNRVLWPIYYIKSI